MKNKELIPSLLSFNKKNWSYFFLKFQEYKMKYIHFDVMDQEYVQNTAYNEKDFNKFIHTYNNLKAHVHLMVMNPLNEIEKYFHKKTDSICFHYDVYKNDKDVFDCINKIKKNGIKAGIAINPQARISEYEKYLKSCDIVTVMGVNPGKGGQKFQSNTIINLYELKDWMKENNHELLIEIDGGMDYSTIPMVINNSNYIVSGSFLAKNINNLAEIVEFFTSLASKD